MTGIQAAGQAPRGASSDEVWTQDTVSCLEFVELVFELGSELLEHELVEVRSFRFLGLPKFKAFGFSACQSSRLSVSRLAEVQGFRFLGLPKFKAFGFLPTDIHVSEMACLALNRHGVCCPPLKKELSACLQTPIQDFVPLCPPLRIQWGTAHYPYGSTS